MHYKSIKWFLTIKIYNQVNKNFDEKDKIKKFFGLQLTQTCVCQVCLSNSITQDITFFLPLFIKKSLFSNQVQTLLNNFFVVEELSEKNLNAFKCNKCDSFTQANKYVEIANSTGPIILVVSLNRFEIVSKANDKFKSKKKLDKVEIEKEVYIYINNIKYNYELFSIILHRGDSLDQGHYYSYCKRKEEEWILFNDTSVSFYNFETILSNIKCVTDTPYMLFYSKKTDSLQFDLNTELNIDNSLRNIVKEDNIFYENNLIYSSQIL